MLLPVRWKSRADPLTPSGVLAFGETAGWLAARVLACDDDVLRRLRGVAGEGVLALLGDADVLPWADGVQYVGRSLGAPSLLLPTCLEPTVGDALLERAVARSPGGPPPLAISPSQRRVISVASARRIERRRLSDWLAGSGNP